MLKNNIVTAWRSLNRERFFSVLNILGLTAALLCTAFIALWVWDEWRRDRYFPNADRIVRVTSTFASETESFSQAVTSVPTGPAMLNDYPEVEAFMRIVDDEAVVRVGEQQHLEEHLLLADSNFCQFFNYTLAHGNARTVLAEPYTVVLTEPLARKYFGDQDPVGQSLTMMLYDTTGRGATYRVTGVLADAPRPSHFTFDMLISFSTLLAAEPELRGGNGWGNNSYFTYLLLKKGSDTKHLEAKMPQFFEKYIRPAFERFGLKAELVFSLQPLSDIYLRSAKRYEIAPTGNMASLKIFALVGLLVLFVAGINYVNMATARATNYARNVGVRKALGAHRGQLARQFLTESIIAALFSAVLALSTGSLLQPVFEEMTGKDITLLGSPWLVGLTLLTAVLLGLMAGLYPAIVLSGFRPVSVLKSNPSVALTGGGSLRKILVVAQFSISIALFISVLVIRGQMDFVKNKNLGYDKSALLTLRVHGDPTVRSGIEAFRNEVSVGSTLVKGLAIANGLPIGGTGNIGATTVDNTGKKVQSSMYRFRIDYDYADVFGLQLLAGRNFARAFPADMPTDTTQNYILNEAAVRSFGWETPEQAIGKPFRMAGRSGQVVGIVRDFHFNSLKHEVEPLAMFLSFSNFNSIVLKIDMSRASEAIAAVETTWKKHFPNSYFDYSFVDERLDVQYRSELRFGSLFGAFSLFSIFIACLGLFGLAAYTAERRTKEIGIRKVLGASVAGITGLLARDFLKLVALAIFIASPVAYYFMQKWLADFAYRIDIQGWMFVAAGFTAVLIAFLTVGFQSVRAALANPVKSLRSE